MYETVTSTDSTKPDEFVISVSGAVVTYVSGSTAFIEDSTAGIQMYMSSHGLVAGNKLDGTITGKAYVRFGVCQISDFDFVGSKSTGAVIPVTTITVADLLNNYSSYVSRRVKIENATVTDAVSGTTDKNGTISQNGSSVNLYNNGSSVSFAADDVVDFIAYPSYHNTDKQLATYEAPTSKKVSTPTISCAGNKVTIEAETGATVYYTTNGTTPTESSTKYTAPFDITSTVTVKAIAVAPGKVQSSVAEQSCTWVDPNAGEGDTPSEPITVSKSISAISGNPTNGTTVSTMKLDNVITATASTGTNNGKVYNSGAEWRLYMSDSGKVTITAASGYTINTVKFTYAISNNGVLLDGTTQITSGTVDTVNAQSVTYTVGRTSGTKQGQVKVTAIEVVYRAN